MSNANTPAVRTPQQIAQRKAREAVQAPGEDAALSLLHFNGPFFAGALGVDIKAPEGQVALKRLFAMALKAYRKGGPRLWESEPKTFFDAVGESVSLGVALDPQLGECYLIPRKRSFKDSNGNWQKVQEVNFQIGYRGVLKLARRSGEITKIKAVVVYENDEFEHLEGTEDRIIHRPCRDKDPGSVVAAYAIAKMRGSNEVTFRVMYRRDLDKVAEMSGDPRSKDMSDVWKDHYAEMALKTVIKRLCKWLPVADDLKAAIIRDDMRDAGLDPGHYSGAITVEQDEPMVQSPKSLDDLTARTAIPEQAQGPKSGPPTEDIKF